MAKTIYRFQHTQKNRSRKNEGKDRKALHKLMNNAIYGKQWKIQEIKLVKNKNYYLKCTSKPSYVSHKEFDNNLVAIQISYINTKEAYIHWNVHIRYKFYCTDFIMIILTIFHYDYINYINSSKLLFRDTDNLMYEIKTEDVYEDFSNDKEMFDFSNCSAKSKYYDNLNKLVIGKMTR